MKNAKGQVEWLVRKIGSKDAAYPFRRLRYVVRKCWSDWCFPTAEMRHRSSIRVAMELPLRSHFISRDPRSWLFTIDDIEEIVARIPSETRKRTVSAAEAIVQGIYTFNGHAPLKLQPVDWDHAPEGDIVWTRELNRHVLFETLGFAYRYSGEERFATSFIDLSTSWVAAHETRIGKLPWDTPLQVARRINSWMWSFFLFLDCPAWGDFDQRSFLRTLGLLIEYLSQTIEYHSPGNHLILEAKTLAQCGEVFPEYLGAKSWREQGWHILRGELEDQICEDGVHAERATMYHRIISGELSELWLLSLRKELAIASKLEEIVRRMANFQRSIDLGNGTYPLFGDSRSQDSYYRFSAPVIAEARRTGMLLPLERGMSDHTWWVISTRSPYVADADTPVGYGETASFPDGGYYVSRSKSAFGNGVLVWDCGPFGFESNRKHAHADALSFVLAVDGEAVLIDPGVGGPRKFRNRGESGALEKLVRPWAELRRTRAHNTVCVDKEDQAVLAGRNEIWNPPLPEVILWTSDETYHLMWGRHDGYDRLRSEVLHDRLVLASRDGYWLVLDRLSGSGQHLAELRYHLAPGSLIESLASRTSFAVQTGAVRLNLNFFALTEDDSPISVDQEERLGELRNGSLDRIDVLRARCTARVPFLLGTFLAFPASDLGVRRVKGAKDGAYHIEVGNDGLSDRIVVQMSGNGPAEHRSVARRPTPNAPVEILRRRSGQVSQVRMFGGNTAASSLRLANLLIESGSQEERADST